MARSNCLSLPPEGIAVTVPVDLSARTASHQNSVLVPDDSSNSTGTLLIQLLSKLHSIFWVKFLKHPTPSTGTQFQLNRQLAFSGQNSSNILLPPQALVGKHPDDSSNSSGTLLIQLLSKLHSIFWAKFLKHPSPSTGTCGQLPDDSSNSTGT